MVAHMKKPPPLLISIAAAVPLLLAGVAIWVWCTGPAILDTLAMDPIVLS